MTYYSTKTYGHNIGLACVFRQPNADHSHCHLLHGYSLQFKFTFGCDKLDNKNWAVDFGGLKPLKKWLEDHFDHKTALDVNDPHLDKFRELEKLDLARKKFRSPDFRTWNLEKVENTRKIFPLAKKVNKNQWKPIANVRIATFGTLRFPKKDSGTKLGTKIKR